MNAVYVAIGLVFARKIYEKACSDPYRETRRAIKVYRDRAVDMKSPVLVGTTGKHPSIAEILEASSKIAAKPWIGGIVPKIPSFSSTPTGINKLIPPFNGEF